MNSTSFNVLLVSLNTYSCFISNWPVAYTLKNSLIRKIPGDISFFIESGEEYLF